MKKAIIGALAALCTLTAGAKDYKYQSVSGDPMHTRIYTLDNGLKVYLSKNTEMPRVTAYIAVNTGHRNDPADCTGLAHYLEHLMFKGTKSYGTSDYTAEKPYLDKIRDLYEEYRTLTDPNARKIKYHEIDSVSQLAARYNIPNEYDKIMATIGSENSNAYTSFDVTCYMEDVPANEIERWLRLQSDRFQNMVIRGFHTELEAVYEEKNMSLANDGEKAFNALMAKLYPSHSYGTQTTIGTQEHLKNPSIVEIEKYFNKYYRPNNVAICMAGDFDYDKMISTIEKHFGAWQKGNDITPRYFPAQTEITSVRDTTVVGQEQELVILGWRFAGASSQEIDTLKLINNVLYNGMCGLIDIDLNQKMAVLESNSECMMLKDYTTFLMGANPKDGQTLEQARDAMLSVIEKLKKGEWDEELLTSAINNMKRNRLESLEENEARVSMMVDAFINGLNWKDHVEAIDRMSKITKEDVIAFANRHFKNNFVCTYKRKGEDSNIKKIEKPIITPIPSNRDMASQYLKNLSKETVEPIHPQFVDFDKDLTKAETKKKLPVLYVQNKDNSLFQLVFRYTFGDRADAKYGLMNDYVPLLGTSKMSNEEIKKQFYKLACDYKISVRPDFTTISIVGLQENMTAALRLLEHFISDAKADKELYGQLVDNILKERSEDKQSQKACFNHLWSYALHGAKSDATNLLSEQELRNTDPKVFTDLLKEIPSFEHTVVYYGPLSLKELDAVITKNHKTAKHLAKVPVNKEWNWNLTTKPEVLIAPYEANNIYLRMYSNEGKKSDISRCPIIELFNEYFGGGMNSIVFQELRETRGLAYNANAIYKFPMRKQDSEYWQEHIITQNDKMMDCINTFRQITDDMPLTESAFNVAKQSILKSLAATRTTKSGIISSYIKSQRLGLNKDINSIIYDAMQGITMQDILNFEQQNVKGKPLHYIILGNENELDIKSLEKIAPIRRVSLEEIFGY